MADMNEQKDFLVSLKKALEARNGKLTWDKVAALAGIEPRTLKTYRMPADSANYRQMPPVTRRLLESLLTQPVKTQQHARTLVPALAALVLSQARVSLIDGQMISGLNRRRAGRNGLTDEERKIMAMVSRHCLIHGLPDYGGEIHVLLHQCTQPFESWLPIPDILDAGYGKTALIHADDGIPTPEAEEIGAGFFSLASHIEEEMFAKLREALDKCSTAAAADYYTTIREFIVRNPVVSSDRLFAAGKLVPSTIWMAVQHDYYEPVPKALASDGGITLCAHCGSMMKPAGRAGLRCQARACAAARPAQAGVTLPIDDCRRVTRGIRQYWVEPGIDEVRLFDQLKDAGLDPQLYPQRDRVDIAVGTIGMDLKTYASPEILGARFRRSVGGLTHYEHKWIVIPDWLIAATPNYIERLKGAMGDTAARVSCLSLSNAVVAAKKHAAHHPEGGEHA